MARNADFDITECLSGSMEQGVAEEGEQEDSNVVVSAVGHQAPVCGLPPRASRQSHAPTLLLSWATKVRRCLGHFSSHEPCRQPGPQEVPGRRRLFRRQGPAGTAGLVVRSRHRRLSAAGLLGGRQGEAEGSRGRLLRHRLGSGGLEEEEEEEKEGQRLHFPPAPPAAGRSQAGAARAGR